MRTHRPIDPSTLKPNLELVHRNSLRLLKLVNTLLDFSRIEAGRMEAVYEPTDLATYTAELSSVFRSAIERAGLQLIVDCPPLPEPVFVDREMWEKIVLNLLSNAFKFTLQGEITVSLRVESRSDLQASTSTLQASTSAPHDSTLDPQSSTSKLDPATSELETLTSTVEISSTEHDPSTSNLRVILQIRDTGAGIAPEHLPHLFERFYQIRETQARTHEGLGIGLALVHELVDLGIAADFLPRVFDRFSQAGANAAKGLGLGLATGHRYPQPCGIARHIVELHHGTIHAHSAGGGQGATFTVTLPLLQNGEG
ncbi:ATP-binding protein [Leptolyngbya ohadii]|uniref:ATP-binding protein n=1 Tax=Leptolyngbya ohadii TaxID=1962290 RepID=UPI0019D425AB|nr:ATP-binding protein [Leptolyngbya ohadii]